MLRNRAGIVVAAAIGLVVAGLAPAPAGAALTPTVTSYPASDPFSSESHPYDIAGGTDGALWFTDPYANKIGRMTTGGTLALQAPVPGKGFQYAITAGQDGAMWFVSQSPSRVSRIDAAGNILTQNLADALAQPTHITAGPENALWFTEGSEQAIGKIPAETPLAVPDESRKTGGSPNDIAAGPDGNLWFTQYSVGSIGRMTPAGDVVYFPVPKSKNPVAITLGPDGALWYTATNPPGVVRIETDGTQVAFPSPVLPFPGEIAAGADGALWFTAFDEIVRVALDGTMEQFPLADTNAGANGITSGPDGNVWFAEQNAGRIGRITTPPNVATGSPESVGARSAKVRATVEGHSQPTGVSIEYVAAGGETRTTSAVQLPASAAPEGVSVALDGLSPSTSYRYRAIATNPTGSTAGAFSGVTTVAAPRCAITRTRRGRGGKIVLSISCSATDRVSARATTKVPRKGGNAASSARRRTIVYGTTTAKVIGGTATVGIRPRKSVRGLLKKRRRLRVTIALTAFGGATSATIQKRVRVRGAAEKRGRP